MNNEKQYNSDDLSFSDSWKTKSVELATTGAIIAGAGALAAKGDLGGTMKYVKKSISQADKGFDRYLRKRSNPAVRLFYSVGRKTAKDISGSRQLDGKELLKSQKGNPVKEMEQFNRRVVDEASRKRSEIEAARSFKVDVAKSEGKDVPTFKPIDPIRLEEEVFMDLHAKDQIPTPTNSKLKSFKDGANKIEGVPSMIGGAISGLGFGVGITAAHALDKKNRENDKIRDKTFEMAGSSFKENRNNRRERPMNKQASVRQIHDRIGGLGMKVPEAMATATGFTGVSLATASALNKKQKEQEDAAKKNRIIIEFGEDELENKDAGGHASMGRMGMVPRPQLGKTAATKPSDLGLKKIVNHLTGKKGDTVPLQKRINDGDYDVFAADSLKGQDVGALAKNQFGHALPEDKAKEKLLASTAKKMKQQDTDALNSHLDDVAKARVYTGGAGLGLVGLGVGANAMNSKKKKEDAYG